MPESQIQPKNDPGSGTVSHTDDSAAGFLTLARQLSALKRVPRTGWMDRGVPANEVESVADHSFGVALLAWAAALERQAQGAALDPYRVLTLALLHDLAEAKTGDVTPYDPIAIPNAGDAETRRAFLDRRHERDPARTAAKRASEDEAMAGLLVELPASVRGTLGAMWEELGRGESAEARFVKQIDRLETFLQSRSYLDRDPDLPMRSFQEEVTNTLVDPLLNSIRDAALAPDDPETSG